MARMDDSSSDCRRWTNAKLMRKARAYANLEKFGGYLETGYVGQGFPDLGDKDANAIRKATRLYRDTWLNPILDEIERRFIKPAGNLHISSVETP